MSPSGLLETVCGNMSLYVYQLITFLYVTSKVIFFGQKVSGDSPSLFFPVRAVGACRAAGNLCCPNTGARIDGEGLGGGSQALSCGHPVTRVPLPMHVDIPRDLVRVCMELWKQKSKRGVVPEQRREPWLSTQY